MQNQRQLYGETLVKLGEINQNVVVLEADLGASTMTRLFEKAFPERYFQMGIAEQNMASFAAGLALTGKIPFINSFSMFVTGRCYEQIRQSICIPRLNVKIVGSSAGLSDFGDGATHQCIEDISLMSGLPHMTIFAPSDSDELLEILNIILDIPGPVYIRINRNELPNVIKEEKFEVGKPRLVKEGKDVVIFTYGVMVSKSLQAAEILEQEGITIRIVTVPTIKPLNKEAIFDLIKGMKCIVIAEEHTVYGGLGSILAVLMGQQSIPMHIISINDRFGQSAKSYEELLDAYELSTQKIINTVKLGLNII